MANPPKDENVETAILAITAAIDAHKRLHVLEHTALDQLMGDSYKIMPKLLRAKSRLEFLRKK